MLNHENPLKLKYKFIYFLGVEGSGKTTYFSLLLRLFTRCKIKARYIAIRSNHLFTYILMNIVSSIVPSIKERKQYYGDALRAFMNTDLWRRLYYPLLFYLDLLSVLVLALVKVLLPLHLGYVVVAENYVIDTLADIQRRLHLVGRKYALSVASKLLLRLIPMYSIVVYLYADYNTLCRRYLMRGSQTEPYAYISVRAKQLLNLLKFASNARIHIVDTRANILSVFRKILRSLFEQSR